MTDLNSVIIPILVCNSTSRYSLNFKRTIPRSNLPVARLLLNLKTVDNRSQLAQDLVGLFVVFQLRSDKICEVAKRLRSVKDLASTSMLVNS